jgi:streptogramin lyase
LLLPAGLGGGAALVAGAAAALVGAAAFAASASAGPDPRALVRTGMEKFRRGQVAESVADFDAALAASPSMRPYLWQRGLSLYYLKQYEEGAKQFRDDVAVRALPSLF